MSTSGARGFSCPTSSIPASTYRTTRPRCCRTCARLPRSSHATCRMTSASRTVVLLSLCHQACPGEAVEASWPVEQAQRLCQGDQVGVIDPRQILFVGAAAVADHRVGGTKAEVLQHRLPDLQLALRKPMHRLRQYLGEECAFARIETPVQARGKPLEDAA